MVWFRRVLVLGVIAATAFSLAACSRKITRVEVTQQPATCFECHSDTNTAIVAAQAQWQNSKHASGETLNENDGDCKGCHTSEGFVARATGTTIADVVDNPTPIHCFTCHAPHTNGDLRLRWTSIATLQNGTTWELHGGDLCAACHRARRNVTTYVTQPTTLSNRWGPHHGPQSDMLIGSNGYQYAGFTYDESPHRTATADGCLDCHFKTTSQLVVGGHSFNMSFMLNGSEVMNVAACATCHEQIDDFAEIGFVESGFSIQDSVANLIDRVGTKLIAAGLLDGATLLPKSVTTSRDSAGAVWNYLITKEDRSLGVHNAAYTLDLLNSSLQYLERTAPVNRLSMSRPPVAVRTRRPR